MAQPITFPVNSEYLCSFLIIVHHSLIQITVQTVTPRQDNVCSSHTERTLRHGELHTGRKPQMLSSTPHRDYHRLREKRHTVMTEVEPEEPRLASLKSDRLVADREDESNQR